MRRRFRAPCSISAQGVLTGVCPTRFDGDAARFHYRAGANPSPGRILYVSVQQAAAMIFVDESIQHDLGYICVGFAYCQDPPDDAIAAAIKSAGLVPGRDEYKSGARMLGQEQRLALRDSISHIVLSQCKLGVYIAPASERPSLLPAVATTAENIVLRNKLPRTQQVMVDEGIQGRRSAGSTLVELVTGCDSRSVFGIQLADYAAYHCSYLLKCAVLGSSKTVVVELPHHPKNDEEVDLDWLTRTELRRSFFMEHRNIAQIKGDDWFFTLSGYGAFYSPGLSPQLLEAARRTFDSMYLGCVW